MHYKEKGPLATIDLSGLAGRSQSFDKFTTVLARCWLLKPYKPTIELGAVGSRSHAENRTGTFNLKFDTLAMVIAIFPRANPSQNTFDSLTSNAAEGYPIRNDASVSSL